MQVMRTSMPRITSSSLTTRNPSILKTIKSSHSLSQVSSRNPSILRTTNRSHSLSQVSSRNPSILRTTNRSSQVSSTSSHQFIIFDAHLTGEKTISAECLPWQCVHGHNTCDLLSQKGSEVAGARTSYRQIKVRDNHYVLHLTGLVQLARIFLSVKIHCNHISN